MPPQVPAALGGATRRVTGTINGHGVQLGLLPLPGGGCYLMLNKDLCRTPGVQLGQQLNCTLAPAPASEVMRSASKRRFSPPVRD